MRQAVERVVAFPRDRYAVPDTLAVLALLIMLWLVVAVIPRARALVTPPPDVATAAQPARLVIETLATGETMSHLAHLYAGSRDHRLWLKRVEELNGWGPAWPTLQPGQTVIVPDWGGEPAPAVALEADVYRDPGR